MGYPVILFLSFCWNMQSLRPPMKMWECNVFTHVCLLIGRAPMWALSMMQWTSLYSLQTSNMGAPRHQTWDPPSPRPWPTLLVTCGCHHWRPVHLRTHRTSTDIWRPKHVWLASGRYASCWNAFLLVMFLIQSHYSCWFWAQGMWIRYAIVQCN